MLGMLLTVALMSHIATTAPILYLQIIGSINMQVLAKTYTSLSLAHSGYIAGANDGVVTVQGKPASRKIWLLNAQTMAVEQVITSLKNGHYLFMGLDPAKRYLVMVRDYKKEFEPFAWDDVPPATDKTIAEQQAMWAIFTAK